jgi:hypothetical protein
MICTTKCVQLCLVPPSDAPLTEGEFSTIAVDKTVDKHVRIARERCYACVATLRL